MKAPVTTRRSGRLSTTYANAAPRKPGNSALPAGFVKSDSLSRRGTRCRSGTRLPRGFMTAVNDALVSLYSVRDCARNRREEESR
jgi:hypothetical protein